MPRAATCDCDSCPKCRKRIYMRDRYWRLTPEQRRAETLARDRTKIRARDRVRNKTPQRVAQFTRASRKWREQNPEKYTAHMRVSAAKLAGKITPEPCEVCGEERTLAHHDDYSKPLEVRWLCYLHHSELHAEQRAVSV